MWWKQKKWITRNRSIDWIFMFHFSEFGIQRTYTTDQPWPYPFNGTRCLNIMLILDDIVFHTKKKMTSVAYSYMTLDTVAHGGVPGNRKSSAYRQPHSRESSVTSGSLSRNYSSKKRKKRKSESKNKVLIN